jgi:ATP-binding protein involved in chromosome partitioning
MSFTQEAILNELKKVIHPSSGKPVTEAGIVQNIRVGDNSVHVILSFPRSTDPLAGPIKKAITQAVQSAFGTGIQVTFEIIAKKEVPGESNQPEALSRVKNIVAVASGKGGVGKSTVAANLAVATALQGYRVGLVDADVYGPSVPKMFGAEDLRPILKTENGKELIVPVEKFGIKVLSIGFFVNASDALIWRGPMATSALRQLLTQGDWGELDYLYIDLPPGTGDVHLTIVQEVPVTGAVIVSTPQHVALAAVIKGISMFENAAIKVPVLGLIENMSYFTPPELPDRKYYIFGKHGCRNLAEKLKLPLLGEIPIDENICQDSDSGRPSVLEQNTPVAKAFMDLALNVIEQVDIRNKTMEPTKRVIIKH